jgi:metallopeptidase MepB
MAAEKYRTPPQAPPVFKTTPDEITSGMAASNDETKALLDGLVAKVSTEDATFQNVMHPILVDGNKASAIKRKLTFYQYVSSDEKLRAASTSAEQVMSDFNIETNMREDVFKLVNAAYETRDKQGLDKEALHIIEKERQGYIRNGLLLPAGEKRDRFKETQKRLSQLCIQCQKNLNEEKGGIWFTPEELEGVPQDDIDVEKLEKGTGENEGKVKVSFKYNHYFAMLKYAKHEQTRRQYVIADANKSNNNVPLFQEILALRDEAARLLGYPNHASVRIEEKMAKTDGRVSEFLGDLRTRLAQGGLEEAEKVKKYKEDDYKERGIPFDENIYMWDSSYYGRQMKEKEYSIDEIKISQYFPVDSTFDGMLKIFEEIFGFVFVELKAEDRARLSPTGQAEDITWHEGVRLYSVWNDEAGGSGFCGYLYIDLHPRDNKYSHNANFNLEPGYIKEDGERHYPVTALVCNFSKPSDTKPGLLKR